MTDNSILGDLSQFRGNEPEKIIIKAVGVGGGGNNAVDHMYKEGLDSVSFVNINTDKQTLMNSVVPNRLVIGNGLGAGSIPEVARKAAEDSADKISALFDDDTKMVFITAGMGGGTGTGAAPVVARIAREHGLLTVGIVTIPFLFEGQKKILKALDGADEMSKYVDALLVINNERLTEIYSDFDFVSAFAKADDTLTTAARSISELITMPGKINLDFQDIKTTLQNGRTAIISSGYGEGENRVTKAIEDALRSPLLKNRDIQGSKHLLFCIFFSRDAEHKFLMEEANELTNFVNSMNFDPEVIWGVNYDESLGDKVKITILASGFDISLHSGNEPVNTKRPSVLRPRSASREEVADANGSDRIISEYGHSDKDRQRYIILGKDQMDDDEIIEILEKTPTLTRDKKTVEQVRNTNGASAAPDRLGDSGAASGNTKIVF